MTTIGAQNGTREIQVGVILDMDSYIGKSSRVCISMALEDFYDDNNGSTVIIRPHYRDPGNNDIQAASAAIDLLKNSQVMAILGPQQSSQANFILDIAEKSKVPMISSATSPDLSPNANNFFIRTAQASSTQAQPIAAIIKSFGWREVVLVFEDSDFGRGLIPYLSDAMENITTHVNRCILLPPSSSDDLINQQLQNLKTMQTRVFVVHMLPALASRFFKKADEARMMTRGSAWIITDVLTIHFNHLVPEDRKFMHGVIGVKPYIPPSKQLTHFHKRWRRRFQKEYPEMDRIFELDVFGIWWYDSVFALATSLQKVETELIGTTFKRPTKASTDLTAIGTSEMGASLVSIIRNTTLKGLLSGDFQVINGQLRIIAYEIVNVIEKNEKRIGFWNSKNGITSNQPSYNESMNYTTNKDDFGAIIWPGDSVEIPKGWEIPTSKDGKLRVGVPGAKDGFVELIHAEVDPKTNETKASGFCVDVFKAVVDALPYAIDYTFIPYGINDTDQSSGDYNHLVHQIVDQVIN
ncbi:glutamate receptor 2.3-like [Cynara cardunculus var. scolymus]|uniref:glutamate receptor 2.3-like n=1 Tax=Cynara cardunculus var. scolymus TaxID=59895 RepID=UPI000D625168|nr:glutamate receptor 2.3-like [Cynara cardunculus var. scolymus]